MIRALFSQDATDYFQDFARAKTMGQKLGHLSKFKPALLAPGIDQAWINANRDKFGVSSSTSG